MAIPFYLTVLLLLSFLDLKFAHNACNHRYPRPEELKFHVRQERDTTTPVKRSTNERLPLRIRVVYDSSLQDLTDAQRSLIQERIIPRAVAFWEKTLSAKRPVKKILLDRHCVTLQVFTPINHEHYCWKDCARETTCGHFVLPESHLQECRYCNEKGENCRSKGHRGQGFENTDFILYTSTVMSDRCKIPNTVAYAAYCQLEADTDRPLAGYVNICPSVKTLSNAPHDFASLLSTVKHEILHALGYSAGLYAFYRDDNGAPLTPRRSFDNKPFYNETINLHQWSSNIVKSFVKTWRSVKGEIKRKFDYIVTPRVIKEVRQHFNCPSLEGAELENQGGHGTEFTHLEKRVFGNEAMTGTYTHNPVFSRITLALMEDTGWFVSNYSMAEILTWGKNLGCDFAQRSCFEFGLDGHPFCTESSHRATTLRTECTEPSLAAVGLCNLIEHDEEVPAEYRYFSADSSSSSSSNSRFLGGSVVLADYCPFVQDFNWRSEDRVVRGSSCKIPSNSPDENKNYALETYGPDSVCLEQYRPWELLQCDKIRYVSHWGSGCYRVGCSTSGSSEGVVVTVEIRNRTYRCDRPGQRIKVGMLRDDWLHLGHLVCPTNCGFVCGEDFEISPEKKRRKNWCYSNVDEPYSPPSRALDSLTCGAGAGAGWNHSWIFGSILAVLVFLESVTSATDS